MTTTHEGDPGVQEFFAKFEADPFGAVNRIHAVTEFEGVEGLAGFALEVLRGAVPVIYANHQSFADGLLLGRVVRALSGANSAIKGYRIPGSATAESQPLHQALLPVYHAQGIHPVGVFTDEEIAQGLGERRHNAKAALSLVKGPQEGFGLALFPEASPDGGTLQPDGTVRGMQRVERDDLAGYARTFAKRYKDRPVVFLPVGIDGSHHLYRPETNQPDTLGIRTMRDAEVPAAFIRLAVGEPIFADNIPEGVHNNYLMGAVAELLPPAAQGDYREPRSSR